MSALKTGIPRNEASKEADAALRELVTSAIRNCAKKREQIAEELSQRVGLRVTAFMLNDFTSACKKSVRFPAAFIEPLCDITGDDRVQRFVMGDRLRRLVEFAERELAASHEERERQLLREELLRNEVRGKS